MTNSPWIVMARQWPGSVPVPCKGIDGQAKRFATEAEARAYAKACRDEVNRNPFGACRPQYFAQPA